MIVNFSEVIKWLKDGKKVHPSIWRRECYIYYDKYFLNCYDEKDHIINLRALSGEKDWEVVRETGEESK